MATITFIAAMATIFFLIVGVLFREFTPLNAMLGWMFLFSFGCTLILAILGLIIS